LFFETAKSSATTAPTLFLSSTAIVMVIGGALLFNTELSLNIVLFGLKKDL